MSSSVSDFISGVDFRDFIYSLDQGGWFDFVFPFMLIYAVVFTILNQVEIFKDKKSVKVIIALVFALFAIAFPISNEGSCGFGYSGQGVSGCTVANLMMALFPGVTAFSMGILALYIVVAMLGVDLTKFFGNDENNNNYLKWILGGLALIVVFYYYGLGFGWWNSNDAGALSWLIGENQGILRDPFLYILAMFGLFFWWITKDDTQNKTNVED